MKCLTLGRFIVAGTCRLFGIEKEMRWGDPLGDCSTAERVGGWSQGKQGRCGAVVEDTRVGLVTVHLQEGREEGKVAEVKPGDWETPVLVTEMAVGTGFRVKMDN